MGLAALLWRGKQSFGGLEAEGQRAAHAGAHGIQTHGNIGALGGPGSPVLVALPGSQGALSWWKYKYRGSGWPGSFVLVAIPGGLGAPFRRGWQGEPCRGESRAMGGRGPRTQAHTGYRRTKR